MSQVPKKLVDLLNVILNVRIETMQTPESKDSGAPKIVSFLEIYSSLGLVPNGRINYEPKDVSLEAVFAKITNPQIAGKLGASPKTVAAIRGIEFAANLLDSFSETGQRHFLEKADDVYNQTLITLPKPIQEIVLIRSMSTMNYFYFERDVARRIKRGDQFLKEEAAEYLLRRGADSTIYEALLEADGIRSRGLTSGFRIRQALWDLRDDVEDLEQDRLTIGANVLLLSGGTNQRIFVELAESLLRQARAFDMPIALKMAIEEQYQKTRDSLS